MKKSISYIFFLLITASTISAFSFSPIIKEFEPSGRGSIQTFRIKNDNEDPIAVQVTMMTRNMIASGEEINSDASDLFTVYPHQLILQAQESQSIRVQWRGSEIIQSELSFRIVAEQLPVNFNKESTNNGQLNIVYRYVGSVYIVPEDPYSDISIESITEKNNQLIIGIKNNGTSHTILEDVILTLEDELNSVTLDYRNLSHMSGENILAGMTRNFTIDRPSQLTGEEISGEISYKETR